MSNEYFIYLFLGFGVTDEALKRRGFRGNQMVHGEGEHHINNGLPLSWVFGNQKQFQSGEGGNR